MGEKFSVVQIVYKLVLRKYIQQDNFLKAWKWFSVESRCVQQKAEQNLM